VSTYRLHVRCEEFQHESESHASKVERRMGGQSSRTRNDVCFMRIRDERIAGLEPLI